MPVLGDNFLDSIALTSGHSAFTVALSGATFESGEPFAASMQTVWYSITGVGAASIAVSGLTADAVYELFAGSVITDLDPLNAVTGVGYMTSSVSPGIIFLRVSGDMDTADVDWTYGDRTGSMILDVISTTVEETPGALVASVSNVGPGDEIHFDIYDAAGTTLLQSDFDSVFADGTGVAFNFSLLMDFTLAAGTYTLHAYTDDLEGTGTFQVLNGIETPPPIVDDPAPAADPPVFSVQKWKVVDPAAVVADWTFPFNPSDMATPHAPKYYTYEPTTAPDGQILTWEGASRALEWTVEGYLATEAFYQKLEDLNNSNQRWWVIDHRLRAWLVSFEAFEPVPKKDPNNLDWSFTYQLKMLILDGPVDRSV